MTNFQLVGTMNGQKVWFWKFQIYQILLFPSVGICMYKENLKYFYKIHIPYLVFTIFLLFLSKKG